MIIRVGFFEPVATKEVRSSTWRLNNSAESTAEWSTGSRGPGIEIWNDDMDRLTFVPCSNIRFVEETF